VGFDPPKLGHRRTAANGRHAAQVAVTKRHRRLATQCQGDVPGRLRAFLLGDLCDAWQRTAVLLERGDVAHDEHVRMSG
jgi:hypothetical protein